jgi:hypothetical protein
VDWGRFSPSIYISPTKHSTDCSPLIIIRGEHNGPFSGLSNSGLGFTPVQAIMNAECAARLMFRAMKCDACPNPDVWCKIWGFHGGDYEEWRLLGRYAVWLLLKSTFRRNLAPPSSRCARYVSRLLVTANVVPSSPILVTLVMVALSSSETSVLTIATRRNIPKDAILHSNRRENLKCYIATLLLINYVSIVFNCFRANEHQEQRNIKLAKCTIRKTRMSVTVLLSEAAKPGQVQRDRTRVRSDGHVCTSRSSH